MDKINVHSIHFKDIMVINCISSVKEIGDLKTYLNTLFPNKRMNNEQINDVVLYLIANKIYCCVESNEPDEIIQGCLDKLDEVGLLVSGKDFIDAMMMTDKEITKDLIGEITDVDKYFAKSFWADKFEVRK